MNWKDYLDEVCPYWVFVLDVSLTIKLVGRFPTALLAKKFVDTMNNVDFLENEEMSYFMVCTD